MKTFAQVYPGVAHISAKMHYEAITGVMHLGVHYRKVDGTSWHECQEYKNLTLEQAHKKFDQLTIS